MGWKLRKTLGTPARHATANALGIFAAILLLVTSSSVAFALNDTGDPAAGEEERVQDDVLRDAHGSDAIYACWIIFRLCLMPLYPYRNDIELPG